VAALRPGGRPVGQHASRGGPGRGRARRRAAGGRSVVPRAGPALAAEEPLRAAANANGGMGTGRFAEGSDDAGRDLVPQRAVALVSRARAAVEYRRHAVFRSCAAWLHTGGRRHAPALVVFRTATDAAAVPELDLAHHLAHRWVVPRGRRPCRGAGPFSSP